MDCGVPFCHWACPLGNKPPEWNDALFKGDWELAYRLLNATNDFPEFTGRICPALCEKACVLNLMEHEPTTNREDEAAMVKGKPHTGLCYYPTKVGRMHRGLKGYDFLGEMIKACHANNIAVIAYFSQIFDNWAYEEHPAWRVVTAEGKNMRQYRHGSLVRVRCTWRRK